MNFLDLNDDVKIIIMQSTVQVIIFISTMFMSKHQDLQKILFGEIVFDNDFRKMMLKKMMILIMLKYLRFIKISMM